MCCCNFYFEGVKQLHHVVEGYFFETTEAGKNEIFDCYGQQILLRVSLPIHLALTIIQTVSLHVLRSTASIIIGIFTLDIDKISFAIKDLACGVVELVALPILAAVTFVAPRAGLYLMDKMLLLHGDPIEITNNESFMQPVWKTINGFVRGIFAIPIGLIVNTTKLISASLICNADEMISCCINYLVILSLPINSFAVLCSERTNKMIHSFHFISATEKENLV